MAIAQGNFQAPSISILILTLSALSSFSMASPVPRLLQYTTPSSLILRRTLPPDTTINILFSLIGLLLAAIAIVQVAFLTRTHFRRSQAQGTNPSTHIDMDMEMDMETLSVNASSRNDDRNSNIHNNDNNTNSHPDNRNSNTSTTTSVREDTLATTSPSHPIAR